MKRGYQDNYSQKMGGAVFDRERRERKAETIRAVIRDYLGTELSSLSLLDVGAAAGFIDNYLADHFAQVIGVDIDQEAIQYALEHFKKENLEFKVADALNIPYEGGTFDVVICTHIYEHVPDAGTLMAEIERVLKPGGTCYFAAGNRFSIMEPHYNLPFLSMLPHPLAHIYLKLSGKGDFYHEKHLTLPGLKKLVKKFRTTDYTKQIIENPVKFATEYMLKPDSFKHTMAKLIVNHIYWLCPSYIWILQKPEK